MAVLSVQLSLLLQLSLSVLLPPACSLHIDMLSSTLVLQATSPPCRICSLCKKAAVSGRLDQGPGLGSVHAVHLSDSQCEPTSATGIILRLAWQQQRSGHKI